MIKILPTIGPKTDNIDSIAFISKFTKILRLNGSHGNYEWHRNAIKKIRDVNSDMIIILDIPGIKPRTGNENNVEIKRGQEVTFCYGEDISEEAIPLTRRLPTIDRMPSKFSLNDGQHYNTHLATIVEATVGQEFACGMSDIYSTPYAEDRFLWFSGYLVG